MAASKVIALRISLDLLERVEEAAWKAAAMRKPGRNEMLREALSAWAGRMEREFAKLAPSFDRGDRRA